MDYHAERFVDHSLLIYEDDKLIALFVACESKRSIISHEGLTYGGILLHEDVRLTEVLSCFFHTVKYYYESGFSQILYKCIPFFLARHPAQDDLFALSQLGAQLVRRDAGSLFVRSQPLSYPHGRKQTIEKAKKRNFFIQRADDPTEFWRDILTPNLQERFGVNPVHNVAEIRLLMQRFPLNIHLYEVRDERLLGGALVYETTTAIHTQYLSASPVGKEEGALDLLVHELITHTFQTKPFVSFGISTSQNGTNLNAGLANWKESFGARTVAHDFYLIETSRYTDLSHYA
jgi:hypothetical protein